MPSVQARQALDSFARLYSFFGRESGEKNPQIETLMKIAAATGIELAIDIAPVGREPKLVGKAVNDAPAHIYAGAPLLVAAG